MHSLKRDTGKQQSFGRIGLKVTLNLTLLLITLLGHTIYHESFEAKNLRGQCITQIFTKKLSRIPIVIAISARFSIATEIFSWKKVSRSTKKPRKPRNFSASKLSWYTVVGTDVVLWYLNPGYNHWTFMVFS